MKSEDSLNDEGNEDNDSNVIFGGKVKLSRKNVVKRKNANLKQIQHQQYMENSNRAGLKRAMSGNLVIENRNQPFNLAADEGVDNGPSGIHLCESTKQLLPISMMTNASYHRVNSTVRQAIMDQCFMNEYSNPLKQAANCALSNFNTNAFTTSVEHILDEEIKFGQLCSKNIPKVVSLGLNVVLDIIKDSYQQNPNICIRSLKSLNSLLAGLKPESLKYESLSMIEKFFELILSLISLSYSSIGRKYNTSTFYYDSFHTQVLELSISCLITLSIARGDTSKILSCIKTLLIDCNFKCNDTNVLLDNFNIHKPVFSIEIPEIMILFKKNVCSFLLGRLIIPEWYSIGFPVKSLCETFAINYHFHKKNLTKHPVDFKAKCKCTTSLAFDGQYLFLKRCNRLFKIGSGYNNTLLGQEVLSTLIDVSHLQELCPKSNKCCSPGGWIGFVSGELFVQPHFNWSHNQVMHFDSNTFKFKSAIPLISELKNDLFEGSFKNSTISTTDGEYIILLTSLGDDYITIREFKPLKITFESKTLQNKENISFSLTSEMNIRLSSVSLLFCGHSLHNLSLPSKNLLNSCQMEKDVQFKSYLYSLSMKLVDTNNLMEYKNISTILTGKDFALMLTEQGKVFYTGNSQSLGIRHIFSFGKWSLLSIPKLVKIIQIVIGHEGNHALLLGEEGTLFFVGTAKRGEDGDSVVRPCHRFNKPSRVKKFAKAELNLNPSSVACNHGTSAIISKSGELYLFGKDSYLANSKGLLTLISKDLHVKSVALGKAHLLILTTNGLVITCGFSNKGQCGLGQTATGTASIAHRQMAQLNFEQVAQTESTSSKSKYFGHLFVYGKTRKCSYCSYCTEFGTKCTSSSMESKPSDGEIICGCGEGNSGCIYCGICSPCSKDTPFCKRFHKDTISIDTSDTIEKLNYKTSQTVKFMTETATELNRFDVHRRITSKLMTPANETEADFDSSSRITSVAPTTLPLTLKTTIKQIAAGLHHSVLLSESGDVYTFGSNQYGQLGHGDFHNRYVPTRIKTEIVTKGSIVQIAAGSNHTALLTSLGEVLTFGNNQNGQLGRIYYNSCKLEYAWNTFPAKVDNVGPEYGRIATFISTSGDFTFIKYDEILLSSNLLPSAKLVAEKNNLVLIPPLIRQTKNFDKLFEEKSCKHNFCTSELNLNSDFDSPNVFNNLDSNILIISRNNNTCSILNPQHTTASKFSNLFDMKNQLNFDTYSAIFVDKFYNNLWTYNSHRDEFSRFNLIEMEASIKMMKTPKERQLQNFPSSFTNLHQLNLFNSGNYFMRNIPSALQPDITVPLSDNCLLRQTPQQLGIELLSFLSSLTYSHLLGISVNDKLDQLNYLSHTFLPEEYLSFSRFEDFGGGWGYPPRSVEAVRFSADTDIILGGIGLYGGRGEYTVQLRLFDIGYDGGELERDGDLLTETDVIHYECLPRQKYQIFFDDPILIQANRWYVIWASVNGPSSDCGSNGQPFICTSDQVMFHFKPSKLSNNGTDVNSGQIPVLFYKAVKSNDLQFPLNNMGNFSLLSLDDEGLPFYISKDFVLKISSACIYSLCDILRYTWNILKSLFNSDTLAEMFSEEENDDKHSDKLINLLSEIKKQIYVSCFVLELIRAYVQIFLPPFGSQNGQPKLLQPNSLFSAPMQKHYDYDEYQRIAQAYFSISGLLSTILTNPIEMTSLVMEKLSSDGFKHKNKQGLLTLIKFNNFFIDECHQTFLSCIYAFYPTNSLKWSTLCDLLTNCQSEMGDRSYSSCETTKSLFTNKQLYLLSAVIKAYCIPSIKLVSFFPPLKGSLSETYEDFSITNEALSPISDLSDLNCQMISKKTCESFKNDIYSNQDYNSQFIFEKLLGIIVRPIKMTIHGSHSSKKLDNHDNETVYFNDYKQFANYHSDNNSNDVLSLNVSQNSSSSSITSSSSSNSLNSRKETHEISDDNRNEQEAGCSFLSASNAAMIHDNSSLKNSQNSKCYRIDSKNSYSKMLVASSCDLMLKFISELNACSIGLLNNPMAADPQARFSSSTEYVTPSRFCRRSSTKSWDTGSGNPEAICFSVNKSGIYISGVRVYSFSMGQLKFQLQLLDQAFDDKSDKCDLNWRTLTSVSGVLPIGDNQNSDFCELHFERPVLINSNVKYAILFKNFSIFSYSGDMGLPQVRGDDDTLFTFMDCSLSKNGTNLNRGQIPQILYYNIPLEANKELTVNSKTLNTLNSNSACQTTISMFKATIGHAKDILKTVNDVIAEYTSYSSPSTFSNVTKNPTTNRIRNDSQLLELLYSTFESVFFKKFIPHFILQLHTLLYDVSLSYEIVVLVHTLLPLVSELNKMLGNYFSYYGNSLPNTTSAHYLVVESDHPYKPASVTTYLVKFPYSVRWISIEFDSKSCTAQDEDYLELYIPNEFCKHFASLCNGSTKLNGDTFETSRSAFRNLTDVYQRFTGKDFSLQNSSNLSSVHPEKGPSNCIYVPGNELVFMLKTSSNYVHSSDDAYYGFKAQVIGYESQGSGNLKDLNDTNSSEVKQEAYYHNVTSLIQNFENDIVYLFNLCTFTLLNSSPEGIISSLLNKSDCDQLTENWLAHFDSKCDIEYANQIFSDNNFILGKSLNFDQTLNMKMITNFELPISNAHSFLADFIDLKADSSGARLALWFQSESFISPNYCLINIIQTIDFCCNSCAQILETNFNSSRKLCSRCHYQFFLRTMPQLPECKNAFVGKKLYFKIVTRDQHDEIAYDPNACVFLSIRFISPFSEDHLADDNRFNDMDLRTLKKKDSHFHKSPLLSIISQNPYQITVRDKCRFHSITMMKAFEGYSLEELRYNTHSSFNQSSTLENVPVKSFENGYYLASWTPTCAGCFQVELIIDGENNDESFLINVKDQTIVERSVTKCFSNAPLIQPLEGDEGNYTKIQLNHANVSSKVDMNPKIRHCIRKFICHDSAGLRIRALPCLQSEQIGIVAVNGLLTIIDQYENDDGIWVRLSNESIQAYCSAVAYLDATYQQANKDIFVMDNFEINEFTGDMKSSQTFTMRTEAWSLQFNRHFNRTLLVPIDSEDDVHNRFISEHKSGYEPITIPGWFKVINCSQDGHLIRNSPNVLDISVIIGIVPLNDLINGVESFQNEFGIWIRLSQDSLRSHIGDLDKSTYYESDIDGWMLAQSVNGLVFMRSIQKLQDKENLTQYCDISPSKYNFESDDNCYSLQAKNAISNSAAQCIRSIFAAFVWHEGILHDVLTAASYLKFNAEVTKEYIKCFDHEEKKSNEEIAKRRSKGSIGDNRQSRKQKAIFRHSVEVSQLLTCWSSDVNSNLNDLLLSSAMNENNNNNNNITINNNNIDDQHPTGESAGESMAEDLILIPEILINLLKIWDYVSTECLKVFTSFSSLKRTTIDKTNIDETFATKGNIDITLSNVEACDNCGAKLVNEYLSNMESESNQIHQCDCNKFRQLDQNKLVNVTKDVFMIQPKANAYLKKYSDISNIQQLYIALKRSSVYLLSFVPSNAPSLTGITENDDINIIDKSLLAHCNPALTKITLDCFQMEDLTCFQSLQSLGIQCSVYEQRLAEEKLSDMAILSFQRGEDYQQLLSPESFEPWKNLTVMDVEQSPQTQNEPKLAAHLQDRKSFKFYRSISVGMNDSHTEHQTKNSYHKYKQHYSGKHIKSTEDLDPTAQGDMFNVPFLCKPSSRLINLVQECINSNSRENCDLCLNEITLPSIQSVLFEREVFRFIFSCYNIDLYSLVLKGTICASAYRALSLNALNWLIVNVSSPVSLHDIMWGFVYGLIPNVEKEKIETSEEGKEESKEFNARKESFALDTMGAIAGKMDVCQHPFSTLHIAGESAESWVTDGLHHFIKSISNLLPLLPMGSSLQQMAVRCFGISFQQKDHIFLHECKVFSHISTILTHSSLEDVNMFHPDYEKSDSDKDNACLYSLCDLSMDVTNCFELRTSSHQAMVSSLLDNSTETFWESGNEDRNKVKTISMTKPSSESNERYPSQAKDPFNHSHIKFVCVYLDNTRDNEYKVSQVSFKILMERSDALKYGGEAFNVNLFANASEIECEKISSMEVSAKFCGWLHCELSPQQSEELVSSFKFFRIELTSPNQSVRVRQVKVLSVANYFDQLIGGSEMTNYFPSYTSEHRKVLSAADSLQIQISNCEAETLRVFRLLTSQVFGKLLANESIANNGSDNKRWSFYQNNNNSNNNLNNENDLREHMVGILFSQSGKLSELQKQVCSHIVKEIHYESGKVREEWELCISAEEDLDSYIRYMSGPNVNRQPTKSDDIPNDAYCFELLSLVLALSGSNVGCDYLAKQNELFFDILTLLHTSSDRVKRQVLSLIRRVIPSIKPSVFTKLLGINELPNLSDIFAKTSRSLSSNNASMQSSYHQELEDNILYHFGVLDIFLACISKSLSVQTKIKGSGSRYQIQHSMSTIFKEKSFIYKQWWLRGSMNPKIGQSIIALLKDMVNGNFGKDWAEVARVSLIEKILNLTHLSENYRLPEQCIQTPTLWLALSSLCVLDESDAEMLSSSNLSKFHDQANGNSSHLYCDNHDDGETLAFIQCNICGNLCADCDRFLHLNTRTRTHKRQIFKEEIDSIKVDIHEGCGRAKFFWALVVADSKLLKAMVEFRVGNLKSNAEKGSDSDEIGRNEANVFYNLGLCRFCGADNATDTLNLGYVCNSEDCQKFANEICTKVHECSHFCNGIRDESVCLSCLHGCTGDLRQDGDDMCMVCFSESLFAAPCIQLACNHIFHSHCIRTVLEKRWTGGRITFTFSQCPICKTPIEHHSLASLLEPIKILFEDVKRKALMRLEYEGLHRSKAITTAGARFYNDSAGFALEKYSYYLCFKCEKAYFGGEARCDADLDNSDHFNPEELICGSCSDVAQAQICPKHGTDYLEYKCRFCCSVAVYFCFGSTHFCNACHEDFQRLVSQKDYPKCPVGPRGTPLEGDECPLHVVHPPTGEEFALGCGICRNAHTF